jgi:hypothetical protein
MLLPREPGRLTRAVQLLTNELATGPQPARRLLSAAQADGVPRHILDLAKRRVGVQAQRVNGRWEWKIAR